MKDSNKLHELLSAAADGECSELEMARVLKSLRSDSELRGRWTRLHLIRAALHGDKTDLLDLDFASRVSRAVDAEAHVLSPDLITHKSKAHKPLWRRQPIVSFAVAASLVAVSFVGVLQLQAPNEAEAVWLVAEGQSNQSGLNESGLRPESYATYGQGTHWNQQPVEIEERLNNYLLNHLEYASSADVQGMLPYSRLAGYDVSR